MYNRLSLLRNPSFPCVLLCLQLIGGDSFKILCLNLLLGGSVVFGEQASQIWIPTANAQAAALRLLRTHLNRDGSALVSDGANIARVIGREGQTPTHTRLGAEVDVTVDPINTESTWNDALVAAHVMWIRRDPAIPHELPCVGRYYLLTGDTDWAAITLPNVDVVVPPAIVVESSISGNLEENSLWDWPSSSLFSISALSSGLAASARTRHRWWIPPIVLGVGTGSIMWQFDEGTGPLSPMLDVDRPGLASVTEVILRIKFFRIWIMFVACVIDSLYRL